MAMATMTITSMLEELTMDGIHQAITTRSRNSSKMMTTNLQATEVETQFKQSQTLMIIRDLWVEDLEEASTAIEATSMIEVMTSKAAQEEAEAPEEETLTELREGVTSIDLREEVTLTDLREEETKIELREEALAREEVALVKAEVVVVAEVALEGTERTTILELGTLRIEMKELIKIEEKASELDFLTRTRPYIARLKMRKKHLNLVKPRKI